MANQKAKGTQAQGTQAKGTQAQGTQGNTLPGNVTVAQPNNGQAVTYGQTVIVGRKVYGGSYYAALTPGNYTLVNSLTTAMLQAVPGSTAIVTPGKLSLQVNNTSGTNTRVCVVSLHGQAVQWHCRFFTQAMFTYAHNNGLIVYGNTIAGQTVNGQKVTTATKAHSNNIVVLPGNTQHIVALAALKAQAIAQGN